MIRHNDPPNTHNTHHKSSHLETLPHLKRPPTTIKQDKKKDTKRRAELINHIRVCGVSARLVVGGRSAARNLLSLIQFRSEVWRGSGFWKHGLVVMEGSLPENLSPRTVMVYCAPLHLWGEKRRKRRHRMWKDPLTSSTYRWKWRRGGWGESGMSEDVFGDRRVSTRVQPPTRTISGSACFLQPPAQDASSQPPPPFFSPPFPETGTHERMGSGAMAQLTRHDTAMRVTATNVRRRNGNKTCSGAQSALAASLRARWRMISVE